MNRLYHVAKREFIETTKTKIFLLSIFITPLIISGAMLFSQRMQQQMTDGPIPPKSITVMGVSGALDQALTQAFQDYNKKNPHRTLEMAAYPEEEGGKVEDLKAKVREGSLDALLDVDKDALGVGEGSRLYVKSQKVSDLLAFEAVSDLLQEAVVSVRVRERNVSPEVFEEIQRKVPVAQVDLSTETEQEGLNVAAMMKPLFFVFLLFITIFGTSQGMLTSVIEEKNSRVMEVLLSALSPFQIMAGKILGLGAVGLAIIVVWGCMGFAATKYHGIDGLLDTAGLGYLACYYVLGFFAFSSMYAAIGAGCNSLKEAQAMMTPLMLVIMLPMMSWFFIVQSPDSTWAVVLSHLPLTSPMVMPMRIAAQPDLSGLEVSASILLLAVFVGMVMWAAAKVFRVGILMYGKPATLREMYRWVRAK